MVDGEIGRPKTGRPPLSRQYWANRPVMQSGTCGKQISVTAWGAAHAGAANVSSAIRLNRNRRRRIGKAPFSELSRAKLLPNSARASPANEYWYGDESRF